MEWDRRFEAQAAVALGRARKDAFLRALRHLIEVGGGEAGMPDALYAARELSGVSATSARNYLNDLRSSVGPLREVVRDGVVYLKWREAAGR